MRAWRNSWFRASSEIFAGRGVGFGDPVIAPASSVLMGILDARVQQKIETDEQEAKSGGIHPRTGQCSAIILGFAGASHLRAHGGDQGP